MSGLGLRVGDVAIGDGDGVLARGDNGILCTDLRRWGDLMADILCLSPWSELGRLCSCDPAGELGVLELGELLFDEVEWEESE